MFIKARSYKPTQKQWTDKFWSLEQLTQKYTTLYVFMGDLNICFIPSFLIFKGEKPFALA